MRLLGARRSLLELVENLDPSRWAPTVVCSGVGGLQEELARAGVAHAVVPHRAWRKGRFLLARYGQSWRIARLMKRLAPTFLHANEFHALPQARTAARFHGWRTGRSPVPVTCHVRLGITPRQMRTYGLEQAARIVVVSRAVAALFDPFPVLRRRVRVVYNGVNLDRFRAPEETQRRRARATLGLAPEDFVVGLVGLIGPRKRQDVAVEALARLAEAVPGLRLVFAGEPFRDTVPFAESLRERVRAAGLSERVLFTGFLSDINPVYEAMDLNLLISNEEGFGRTIIEAGATGVPSIGSRIGGIPELIEEGETGWLIDDGDVEGLARLLREAAAASDRVRAMGESARRHVLGRFSIQSHVRAMETLWEEMLDGKTE